MEANTNDNPPEPAPRKKRRVWLWVAAGALFLCVLVAAGFGALVIYNGVDTSTPTAEPVTQPAASATEQPGSPSAAKPSDQWGPANSTQGMQLILKEMSRQKVKSETDVTYAISSSGLPTDQVYTMWFKPFTTEAPIPKTQYKVDASGALITADSGQPLQDISVGAYARGQAFNLALMNEDKSIQVFATVIPFPIEASSGTCQLTAELAARDGTTFMITGGGFEPNETINMISNSEGEVLPFTVQAGPDGVFHSMELPAVVGKQSGTVSDTATGKKCNLTLKYTWGPDALQIQ
jgi:hypothetical protein